MSTASASPRGTIAVLGLWHLGSVTAACLAEAGYDVLALDADEQVVRALSEGRPPVSEPGLAELTAQGIASGRLRFSTDPNGLREASIAWVAFDTPVDEHDHADVELVISSSVALLAALPGDSLVVVSSQLPVGSVAALAARCQAADSDRRLRFACVPENLRLGQALDTFRRPDRVVAGVRGDADRDELAELLAPFASEVQWMRVESAEMTKHALNGFLATSVAYINELAAICEAVGADASEVSRGLTSDRRIGPRAYLSPGDAYAGGTLARDIGFMRELAARHELPAKVLAGVAEGNEAHKRWSERKLLELLGPETGAGDERGAPARTPLEGRTIAIWGLAYKPGTDTLRRSGALELADRLAAAGASVRAHDPAVKTLPPELAAELELHGDPIETVAGVDALVLCTAWPEYRELPRAELLEALGNAVVVDPAGVLRESLGGGEVRYVRVGGAPLGAPGDTAERSGVASPGEAR